MLGPAPWPISSILSVVPGSNDISYPQPKVFAENYRPVSSDLHGLEEILLQEH